MTKAAADTFREMLERNREIGRNLDRPGFPLGALEALQGWQRERFSRTYADFLSTDTDGPACRFFLDELYGGLDFRKRDEEVSRVAPVMARLLPESALDALADAFRLQAISLELDIAMVELGPDTDFRSMSTADYANWYRSCGRRAQREAQISLIRELGHRLDRLVRAPMLLRLVGLLRGPAHAAGFGDLQEFLEHGLHAFRGLADTERFVETIYRREWRAMERLFAGDDDPYADLLTV
ncbi:FFLEELY motif protein [Elongatibacter sediminis]|uniref:DUF8198 domain-containing protein n=1 Tax=Elongatibacter sediminis TaxID=3119006 RepID=A0AAW9RD04_9GAMM